MANTYSVDLESGSSQYLSIAGANQTGLNITVDGSFEFWVKLESAPASGDQMVFLQKMEYGEGANSKLAYYLSYFNDGGTYKLRWVDSANGTDFGATVNINYTIPTGTWTHIAAVKNNTNLEWFVNGSSIGSVTVTDTLFDSSALFLIGAFYNNDSYSLFFDGLIDEVRVWSDVRTAGEISANCLTELVGNEANLVAYWQLNNGLEDLTSNNNDLTNNNSATFSTDVPFNNTAINSQSIDLEASSSQYLSVADSASLSITGDITLEAWIKLESAPGTNVSYNIISKYKQTGNNRSYQLFYYQDASDDEFIGFYASTNGTAATTWLSSITALSTGTWYHIAATLDVSATTAKIYVNGALHDTKTDHAGSIYDGTAPLEIGAGGDGPASFFDGLIDEARVWNVVRTVEEISANYETQLDGDETGLVAYYKLNNNLLDLTSNKNNLTNNNAAVFSTDVPFTGEVADTGNFFLLF